MTPAVFATEYTSGPNGGYNIELDFVGDLAADPGQPYYAEIILDLDDVLASIGTADFDSWDDVTVHEMIRAIGFSYTTADSGTWTSINSSEQTVSACPACHKDRRWAQPDSPEKRRLEISMPIHPFFGQVQRRVR